MFQVKILDSIGFISDAIFVFIVFGFDETVLILKILMSLSYGSNTAYRYNKCKSFFH